MVPIEELDRTMGRLDLVVLGVYLVGLLAIGVICARTNRTTRDMFTAGGRSPWWVAGVSAFMTMFSAGTFVVWGGVAYRHGMVAVAINVCYGLSALLVGWTVAGRWRRLNAVTPAEYVVRRFGNATLHLYTWALLAFKLIGSAIALYSLAVLLVAVVGGSGGSPIGDNASMLALAIVILGAIVVFYTMLGGLWGVLLTDAIQFVVLTATVLVVASLALARVGGVADWARLAPVGFFSPTGGQYTLVFLSGWVVIHYFVVGAEWAFVQRYLCVATERDAQKAAYLFGGLYVISPLLWLLPPMVYRVARQSAEGVGSEALLAASETAYIDVCRAVLPAGLLGLAFAAMFSATASMLSSQLNVFAGVLTSDVLRPRMGEGTSERTLVWLGRVVTVVLGTAIVALALAVPTLGGAEAVIVSATSLAVVPLLAPLLIGLFSKRLPSSAAGITAAATGVLVVWVKVIAPLAPDTPWSQPVESLRRVSARIGVPVDFMVGLVVPAIILTGCYATARGIAPGWARLGLDPSSELGPLSKPSVAHRPVSD